MGVMHISEAEAARDLPSLLAKVRAGERVRIEAGSERFDLVRVDDKERPRLLSEVLSSIREHAEVAGLEDGFADDVESGMRQHRQEVRTDPWG